MDMTFNRIVVASKGRYLAVIKCTADDKQGRKNDRFDTTSCLYDTYSFEKDIRIISCESIGDSAFVCSDLDSISKISDRSNIDRFNLTHVMWFKSYNQWPDCFINCKWE